MTRALIIALGLAAAPLAAQVEIDNAWVRVARVHGAGKGPAAEHLPTVVVYLTDSDQRITGTRGKTRDVTRKAGDVVFEDTGVQHETLSKRAEFVSIELKQKPAGTVPVALDPVKLDPQHHIVLLENDRVRVLRTILEPQVKAPMHEHPHYVVVYLTELHTSMHMSDGRLIDNVRRAGEIGWRDALKHETENLGDRTAVEIQVELK